MTDIIIVENLKFIYEGNSDIDANKKAALENIFFKAEKGEFISILGKNGSGKSTLARIINTLLIPSEGVCYVGGMDSRDEKNHWEIRKMCGMVFQNPDNQIIGTSVEEDVAFGLENIGVPHAEMRERIDEAMKYTGIYEKRESAPHYLSGGQKQRVAISGILAMKPECIVLDEATAMLDPIGRKEVMSVIRKLNKEMGITVLHITHNMDEAVLADKIIVVDDGRIVMEGTPKTVFSSVFELKKLGLDVPQVTELVTELINRGYDLPKDILTVENAVRYLHPLLSGVNDIPNESGGNDADMYTVIEGTTAPSDEYAIVTKDLSYVYSENTPFETAAINNISLSVKKGSFTCLIGHTGCGKSTLIQHFNGLLKPSSGSVYINNTEITNKGLKELRQKVGLLFQYPEHQLFEETVYKDIAFGLKKSGLTEDEIYIKVRKAISDVGLSEDLLERSIYSLSGGQKRRVAIAGVFVMEPELLILDEPTAGLDPKGRDEILGLIRKFHSERKVTVILVSHSMEDVAKFADYIIVMNKGNIEMEGEPEEIFTRMEQLEEIGLASPQITYLMMELNKINTNIKTNCITVESAAENILDVLKGRNYIC